VIAPSNEALKKFYEVLASEAVRIIKEGKVEEKKIS
jgi:hypothetical protein